jgi:hypothetical protein
MLLGTKQTFASYYKMVSLTWCLAAATAAAAAGFILDL